MASIFSLHPSHPPTHTQEIRNMRIDIAAQKEIITIMEDGLQEHERHHAQCSQTQKAS